MRIGLPGALGTAHLRFWEAYLGDLGAELVRPSWPAARAYALGQDSLADEPPPVQLVLGQLLELGASELGGVDAALLPQLAGLPSDPWGEDLGEVLARRISSLPSLLSVPGGGEGAARAAAELGARLTHNPALVQRALERRRPLLRASKSGMPELRAPSKRAVAVIGPDLLLGEPFLLGALPAQLEALGLHPIYSGDLPASALLERALRAGAASPAERALAGARSLLEGKAAVRGLIFAVPARSPAWRSAAQRRLAGAYKPAMVLEVAPERQDWTDLHAFADGLLVGGRV